MISSVTFTSFTSQDPSPIRATELASQTPSFLPLASSNLCIASRRSIESGHVNRTTKREGIIPPSKIKNFDKSGMVDDPATDGNDLAAFGKKESVDSFPVTIIGE